MPKFSLGLPVKCLYISFILGSCFGTPLEEELGKMMKQIRQTVCKSGAFYNGGISKKQLEWLKKELETAKRKSYNILTSSSLCRPDANLVEWAKENLFSFAVIVN